jgi:hypothetical protein
VKAEILLILRDQIFYPLSTEAKQPPSSRRILLLCKQMKQHLEQIKRCFSFKPIDRQQLHLFLGFVGLRSITLKMRNHEDEKDEIDRACSTNGEKRSVFRIMVGKPEGKRPLGRTRHRWADDIEINLRERGWDGMDWIELAQGRDQWRALVNMVLNIRVP